ncbi:hypothetical protein WDU94_011269, partial [Cyamophila willieti]
KSCLFFSHSLISSSRNSIFFRKYFIQLIFSEKKYEKMISIFQVVICTVTLSSLKQISSQPVGKLDESHSPETLDEFIGPRMEDGSFFSKKNSSVNPDEFHVTETKTIDKPTGPTIENESSQNIPKTQDETRVKTTKGSKESIKNYEPISIVNGNRGDIPDPSEPFGEDSTDELVYAEDPVYKEYNLTLYTPDNDETSGSLSAATLITALGLPATSSFVQALLTAYSLPNGPSLVEDLISKLLLIDDNLLVNIVQSLGKDGLKNQGITLDQFKDFLLDDDNESLNLMMRLFIDAAKGNKPVNVQLDNLPLEQIDHFPKFEMENGLPDEPIIYTPLQENIPARRPPFAQRPTPQPLVFYRILPTSYQNPHQGQTSNPSRTYFFSPQPDYPSGMNPGPIQSVTNLQPRNPSLENSSNRILHFRNPQISQNANVRQSPVSPQLQLNSAVSPGGHHFSHAPINGRSQQLTGSQHSPLTGNHHFAYAPMNDRPQQLTGSQHGSLRIPRSLDHPKNKFRGHLSHFSRNLEIRDSPTQADYYHQIIQPIGQVRASV